MIDTKLLDKYLQCMRETEAAAAVAKEAREALEKAEAKMRDKYAAVIAVLSKEDIGTAYYAFPDRGDVYLIHIEDTGQLDGLDMKVQSLKPLEAGKIEVAAATVADTPVKRGYTKRSKPETDEE